MADRRMNILIVETNSTGAEPGFLESGFMYKGVGMLYWFDLIFHEYPMKMK